MSLSVEGYSILIGIHADKDAINEYGAEGIFQSIRNMFETQCTHGKIDAQVLSIEEGILSWTEEPRSTVATCHFLDHYEDVLQFLNETGLSVAEVQIVAVHGGYQLFFDCEDVEAPDGRSDPSQPGQSPHEVDGVATKA